MSKHGVAEGLEGAACAVDAALHGGHLDLQFVGVHLLGGAHVDGALACGGQLFEVGEAGVEQTDGLFHHEDADVDVLHVGACLLFGLLAADVGHLHGDVLQHGAYDLGAGDGDGGGDAEGAAGVHGNAAAGGGRATLGHGEGDGHRPHGGVDNHGVGHHAAHAAAAADVHGVAAHVLVVEAGFDLRQHGAQSLPAGEFRFLGLEVGVLHGGVVLECILLGLLQAKAQDVVLGRGGDAEGVERYDGNQLFYVHLSRFI